MVTQPAVKKLSFYGLLNTFVRKRGKSLKRTQREDLSDHFTVELAKNKYVKSRPV